MNKRTPTPNPTAPANSDPVGAQLIAPEASAAVGEGWRECKLGDVLYFGSGKDRPKQDGNIPVYGGNGILGYANQSNYENETIVIGRVGAYCGSVYYENRAIWVSDNALSAFPKNGYDARFLYYFLKDMDLNSHAGGSSHPLVTQTLLNSLDVSVCIKLSEQKSIASVLSSLDDKIDLLHRQNQTLKAMAQTLFRQWFVEEARADWYFAKLGDCVNISYGKSLPTKNLLNEGFPVFGANGQIGFYGLYTYDEPQVLVSCRGEASGKVNVSLPKSFVTNNSLVLERSKIPEISFEYLKHWALSYDFDMHVSGSAQPQITIDGLYGADFAIPPKELIGKFTELVNEFEIKKLNNFYQIQTLTQLRDTLLPKLMSGKVLVS